ncbi:MAG: magnesium transporter, partial [Dehalococcoidia bacterium]
LARPSAIISDIMDRDVISVPVGTDQEESARLMDRYNLNYLPVIEQGQKLVGLILVEDVVDVLQEEATEDMYRISGLGRERLFGPLKSSVARRLPWLFVNLGTTVLAALVISLFESTIEGLVILAVFLPMVAGQGGIGGTQTLTLVVRGMALGEIFRDRGYRLLTRELALGLMHGVLLGVAAGVLAWVWKGNATLGLVLGIAMMGNMVVAGLTGAGVPLMLRKLGMDPAVSAAVFVTTVTDVLGFLLFLGLAAALVNP